MLSDFERAIQVLWKQGKTMTEIAAELDVTRNVVSGQIYRMRGRGIDMGKRVEPVNKTFGGTAVIIRRPKPINLTPKSPRKAPLLDWINNRSDAKINKPLPPQKEVKDAKSLNIGFWKLKNDSCRYVVNEGRPENFIFCGAPKERGPYCEAHAKICYNVPTYEQRRDIKRTAARFG